MTETGSAPVSPERHQFSLSATLTGVPVQFECTAWKYPVSQRGVTLIFNHGVAGFKEQYQITISRLLGFHHSSSYRIREIWSVDMPNHGEAATLNRRLLDEYRAKGAREGLDGTCTIMDYAAYLKAFLLLPRFRGHDVVGVAHSGGCTVWIHALTEFDHVYYPNALILVEPTLMFPDMSPTDPRSIHGAANVRGALSKRDTWSSRAELRHWMTTSAKTIWKRWDPRVLDFFVEYGFEDVKLEGRGSYITPKLRKEEESPLYACLTHTIEPRKLAAVCKALNGSGKHGVHILWAEFEEFITKSAKAEMLEAAEHRVMSERTVMGSGHLVPQLQPDKLGDAIHEVLGLLGRATKSSL